VSHGKNTSHRPPVPGCDFTEAVRDALFPGVSYRQLSVAQWLEVRKRSAGLLIDAGCWPRQATLIKRAANKTPERRKKAA
jgi:hypothetical protein